MKVNDDKTNDNACVPTQVDAVVMQNAGMKTLKEIRGLEGGLPHKIIKFYSALYRFKQAGLNIEQIMDCIETVEPEWIKKWKNKYT